MTEAAAETVGVVSQLWRYPVKSMGGEQIASAAVDGNGLAGDRGWAIREAGETRTARQIPRLLQCVARYAEAPTPAQRSPQMTFTLPDDATLQSDAADVNQRLSDALGREVVLTALRPADDLEHYRRPPADPNVDQAAQIANLRQVFGLEADDPLPDFGALPMDVLAQFSTPPGTYFDAYPIHIMTTASLNALAEAGGGEDVDVRRFRPNVLIDTGDAAGLLEVDWNGRRLRLGEVVIELKTTTVRCSIPAHAQRGFGSSRAVGRALIEQTKQHLGSYCNVIEGGTVNVGDPVELLD